MNRLIIIILSTITACYAIARDVSAMSDDEFRDAARSYVTKGNREYERSYRTGIKLYADSLERLLTLRSEAGLLVRDDSREDSLEFTADLLKLRGDWHYENGNYDSKSFTQAERFFRDAMSIYETNSSLRGTLDRLPMMQREMAQLMYRLGRYDEALSYTAHALDAFVVAFDNGEFDDTDEEYPTMLALKSQKAMCLARTCNTQEALSMMDELLGAYPRQTEDYNELLRKKGKIIILSGTPECATEALPLYRQSFAWRKADALKTLGTMTSDERQDYWMRMRPFVADCYLLEDADPAFLYDVALFSKGLLLQLNRMSGHGKASDTALNSLKHTWRQIQQNLPEDAAAIEFVQYEKDGKEKMGAVVLKKAGSPVWVQMMDPDAFMKHEIGGWTNKERLFTTDGRKKNQMYNDSTLKASLWNDGLREALGSSKKIFFAPDGYLHQVGVEYMLPESMGSRDVYRLTSTRRLMEAPEVRTDAALIVGGVKYDATEVDADNGNDSSAYTYMQNIHARFSPIPGSLSESSSIYTIRSCGQDTLLTDSQASELAFRTLCNQYPILNISTHGYFGASSVPQGTDIKTSMTDESLSECVIAMAGANPDISSLDFNPDRMDGMLSAREISECDLSEVDLAVISACQTGLGYVTADGVFGIQRGLKNAGAKCLLVSLWNVSDTATSLLMTRFHKNLRDGMTVHAAFMAARDSLCESADSADGRKVFNASTLTEQVLDDVFEEPQFRDAFILIDALE